MTVNDSSASLGLHATSLTPRQDESAQWIDPAPVPKALSFTGSALLDSVLYSRGVRSESEARVFLNPVETQLGDPFLLPDMKCAVTLIKTAISENRRIVVFGDYDVDGLTSTAMLVRVLRKLGADPVPIIPHRIHDGYGVNPQSLGRILGARPELLITVDCGSSSPQEFQRILSTGAQAIVLDHHHYSDTLPPDVAFVSAQRPDNQYPTTTLAAVGVAYTLVRALLGDEGATMYLPYVALGSIADVVELTGENRALVARGLSKMRRWTLPGLIALCDTAGVDQQALRAWDIGFLLGPRLNASGRVDSPQTALDLLLADNTSSARPLAEKLTQLNDFRRRETQRIIDEAEQLVAALGGSRVNPAFVLSDAAWPVGIAGLVAARLAERHYRPTIILQEEGAVSRGSARSTGDVDIVDALSTCEDLLDRYGGHSAAAGLTIQTGTVAEFRSRLSQAVLNMLNGAMPRRTFTIDAIAGHADLTMKSKELLEQLEPCGHGNPQPTLLFHRLRHRYAKTSRDGAHLMFQVLDERHIPHRAVLFGAGARLKELQSASEIDVIARLERNTWQGSTRLELRLVDFRASQPIEHDP